MWANTFMKKVYVYGTNGSTGSMTEINTFTSTPTYSGTTNGLPISSAFGLDPPPVISGNPVDEILYIAMPDLNSVVTYDPQHSTVHTAAVPVGANEVNYNPTTNKVTWGSFGSNVIFQTK
jgi:hypothetical protein